MKRFKQAMARLMAGLVVLALLATAYLWLQYRTGRNAQGVRLLAFCDEVLRACSSEGTEARCAEQRSKRGTPVRMEAFRRMLITLEAEHGDYTHLETRGWLPISHGKRGTAVALHVHFADSTFEPLSLRVSDGDGQRLGLWGFKRGDFESPSIDPMAPPML